MPDLAQHAFARIVGDLTHMPLSHVWRGHGSALFLEFGILTPTTLRNGSPGNPRGQITVQPGCDWRFERNGRVICACYGDEDAWEVTWASLLGQRIVDIWREEGIPDLTISFEDGTRLPSFVLTDRSPLWSLTDRRPDPEVWVYWRKGSLFTDDGTAPYDD